MENLNVATRRGSVLNGVLFGAKSDTVVIAITGIHGNFYSNPFYYTIGDTLNAGGIDFIYAQTCDAFGEIETVNVRTNQRELIGSWNERFAFTDEDIDAYLDYAAQNYRHVILAGHSLGANKVISYLAHHHDTTRVEHFILMSPANLAYMMSNVSDGEKDFIRRLVRYGRGEKILPFAFMGWVVCTATSAPWTTSPKATPQNFCEPSTTTCPPHNQTSSSSSKAQGTPTNKSTAKLPTPC